MYTVTVYATPMSFPLNFTIHSWIEISDSTTINRYDLWGYPGLAATPVHGYMYKNIFPEHRGTTLSPFASVNALTERQIGRVVLKVSGVAGTPAATLYTAINNHVLVYPYARQYNMVFGPNCNTFTQWLLELVPATRLSLPWYAWGKNYRHP